MEKNLGVQPEFWWLWQIKSIVRRLEEKRERINIIIINKHYNQLELLVVKIQKSIEQRR